MTQEIIIVLSILAGAVLLFISNRIRIDLIGLLVLSSLAISGILTPSTALSGFSNPAVITVWAVLILSGGLARTGIASKLGKFVLRLAGESDARLLLIIMLSSGILSGFMNSIGVASLFLPVVLDIARRTDRPPSRLLMPLAFSSLLGGLNTLIGTPPNILISEALAEAGLAPFQMFDFTPLGIPILLVGTAYMILLGRHLLPKKDFAKDLQKGYPGVSAYYDLQQRLAFIQLPESSHLEGKTLLESRLGAALELNVVTILRGPETIHAPSPGFTLQSGDRLLVQGKLDQLAKLEDEDQSFLEIDPLPVSAIFSTQVQLAEAAIPQGSSLAGMTLRQSAFRLVYQVMVLAIRRDDQVFYTGLEEIPLRSGDNLLVKGQSEDLQHLAENGEFILSQQDAYPEYQLDDLLMMVRVPEDSILAGTSLADSRLGDAFGLSVQGILSQDRTELMPGPDDILQAGDILIIKGAQDMPEYGPGITGPDH